MIGIYKITNPKSRTYIGQSLDIEKRKDQYTRLINCVNQVRLYNSLVKYGFCEHIFEIVEECTICELNVRERYWQDFYDVLSEKGLNCKLTGTSELKQVHSQEVRDKISANLLTFWKSPEGVNAQARRVLNTDFKLKTANTDYVMRTANTDWKAKSASMNYSQRTANTDYKQRAIKFLANMDYEQKAKKCAKAVVQYDLEGNYIQKWSSVKDARESTGAKNVSACCKGTARSSKGFTWKYCTNE